MSDDIERAALELKSAFDKEHAGKATDVPPYGFCECDRCAEGWCKGKGPAAISVEREGKRIKVCSRCCVSTDADWQPLYKTGDDLSVFRDWDDWGFEQMLDIMAEEDLAQ